MCVLRALCAKQSSSSYLLCQRFSAARLERKTSHNLVDQLLQPVSRGRQIAINLIHCSTIIPLQAPAQSVREHLLDQAARELGQIRFEQDPQLIRGAE